MFGGKLGLHIIKFPSGRWGYVGAIPVTLGTEIPATIDDVMGCRTHKDKDGNSVVWKFPTFETCCAAIEFAESRGCQISQRDELK